MAWLEPRPGRNSP